MAIVAISNFLRQKIENKNFFCLYLFYVIVAIMAIFAKFRHQILAIFANFATRFLVMLNITVCLILSLV